MDEYKLSYATPEEAKYVFNLFYHAFINKFKTMLPETPENGFYLYYEYFFNGLKRKKDKIILLKNSNSKVLGFLALEGLGVPFFSGNPGLLSIANSLKLIGVRKFIRLFIGMFLIEGYPPSTDLLYVNTVIIDKKFQRQGLGQKLIKIAEKIAEKRNFRGICLYVDADNLQAMKFYEKLHFKEDSGFGGDFVKKLIGVRYYSYQYKLVHEY